MNEQTSNPNAINEGTNEQAAVSSLPARPEPKPEVVTEVQPEVQKETDSQAADKRKQVLDEAVSALALTKSALAALDEKESARALATLAEVTGKLELIVAREPTLALAPVDVRTIVHDLFANTETVEAMTDEALDALKHGEVQRARRVLALLVSEIVITVTNIPLASYPAAVKAVVPLIDQGKIEEAKAALQLDKHTKDSARLQIVLDRDKIKRQFLASGYMHLPGKKIVSVTASHDELTPLAQMLAKSLFRQAKKHFDRLHAQDQIKRKARRERLRELKVRIAAK
ncbi:YfdX family protein, partial [Escherichia coli]|uniref:YfdX family protein n=1 Tax=Escherichia coli TaxID=562 RepID=UPI0029C1FEFE